MVSTPRTTSACIRKHHPHRRLCLDRLYCSGHKRQHNQPPLCTEIIIDGCLATPKPRSIARVARAGQQCGIAEIEHTACINRLWMTWLNASGAVTIRERLKTIKWGEWPGCRLWSARSWCVCSSPGSSASRRHSLSIDIRHRGTRR
jgi:hypothetical protein